MHAIVVGFDGLSSLVVTWMMVWSLTSFVPFAFCFLFKEILDHTPAAELHSINALATPTIGQSSDDMWHVERGEPGR